MSKLKYPCFIIFYPYCSVHLVSVAIRQAPLLEYHLHRSSIRLPPIYLLFEDCNAMVSLSQYIFSNVPLLNSRKEVVHYFWGCRYVYITFMSFFMPHIFSLIVETYKRVVIYEHSAPFSKIADRLLYFLCFFIILYTVDFEQSMQSTISFTDIPLSYRSSMPFSLQLSLLASNAPLFNLPRLSL